MGEVIERDQKISANMDRIESSKPESIRMRVKALREKAAIRIRDVRTALNDDPQHAKPFLPQHVEKIMTQPDGQTYMACGQWNLLVETLG